jgi:hypothetical protein
MRGVEAVRQTAVVFGRDTGDTLVLGTIAQVLRVPKQAVSVSSRTGRRIKAVGVWLERKRKVGNSSMAKSDRIEVWIGERQRCRMAADSADLRERIQRRWLRGAAGVMNSEQGMSTGAGCTITCENCWNR